MADDFNPTEGTLELPTVSDNKRSVTVYPPDGAAIAIGVIVASSNKAAIIALLDQIDALADESVFKKWTANSLPGKRAMAHITGRVFRTADPA